MQLARSVRSSEADAGDDDSISRAPPSPPAPPEGHRAAAPRATATRMIGNRRPLWRSSAAPLRLSGLASYTWTFGGGPPRSDRHPSSRDRTPPGRATERVSVSPMEHAHLGRTGLQVSRICLGTMTFGFQCDEATSRAILDAAADAGITFLDTADVYPLGGSLEHVGAHRGDRRPLAARAAATASSWPPSASGAMGRSPWDQGASRKHILDAVDASLRRLGTDYVDLYQLHGDDPDDADRRDARGARRPRARGQGALRRLLELPRLPHGPRHRPQRGPAPGALRLGAAPLQPAVPPDRARAAAAVRGGGRRRHPLQPARRRAAHRQARPHGAAARGHAVHPRPGRLDLPGPLLARPRVRHRRGAASGWPTRPA